MRIIVTGRHFDLTEDLKKFVEEKVGKLTHYYDRIHEFEAVISADAGEVEVEVIARADQHQRFVGKERNADPFVAVDKVVDHLKRQITRHKESTRNRMHEGRGTVHGGPSAMQSMQDGDKRGENRDDD